MFTYVAFLSRNSWGSLLAQFLPHCMLWLTHGNLYWDGGQSHVPSWQDLLFLLCQQLLLCHHVSSIGSEDSNIHFCTEEGSVDPKQQSWLLRHWINSIDLALHKYKLNRPCYHSIHFIRQFADLVKWLQHELRLQSKWSLIFIGNILQGSALF